MSATTALITSSPGTPHRGRARMILLTPDKKNLAGRTQGSKSVAPPPGPDFTKGDDKRRSRSNVEGSKKSLADDQPLRLRNINLGFSFFDDKSQCFIPIGKSNTKRLEEYLTQEFKMTSYKISEPFLVIWTEGPVPAPEDCPFMIADLVAVWLERDQRSPRYVDIGIEGQGNNITASEKLVAKAKSPFWVPDDSDINELWIKHFPVANAISVIDDIILVELPRQDIDVFNSLLKVMPGGIEGVDSYLIFYLNGPLYLQSNAGKRGKKKASPRSPDYTDYIEKGGYLSPGVSLEGFRGEFTCSVLLRRGNEERLLVPWHCCYRDDADPSRVLRGAERDKKRLSNAEEYARVEKLKAKNATEQQIEDTVKGYRIHHGDKHIGNVVDRIEGTDFGLVKLFDSIEFSNEFFGSNFTAKKLLHSDDLQAKNIKAEIDSFISDKQNLRIRGKRTVKKATENTRLSANQYPFKVKPEGKVTPGKYFEIRQEEQLDTSKQIIATTGNPSMTSQTTIYDRICGTVLLHKGWRKDEEAAVASRGEIIGVIHWINQIEKNDIDETLLQLAEVMDPLIEAGWDVATKDDDNDDTEMADA